MKNKPNEFDEYLQQSEPGRRDKAQTWRTAIGLQAVDGLTPSGYLVETAKRHIEGDISIDEVRALLDSYYEAKASRTTDDADTEEADKVSANITKLLNERTFSFSPAGLAAIHRRIFDGVFKFAGRFRQCNISKREWVLQGESVLYVGFSEIRQTLEYDLGVEREFSYKNLSPDEMIKHFAQFISGLWQLHPFREGNTRTTAVFAIKYLRAMGFPVANDLFAEHAWYFRNALVRANYRNYASKIEPALAPLEFFFRNLLLNEHHELKNRALIVAAPQEMSQSSDRTSTGQVPDKLIPESPGICRLLRVVGDQELSVKGMMEALSLRHRETFLANYLNPAIAQGFVRLLYPDSPRHPRQKYLLTVKGTLAYQALDKKA
jgi:fido (protein-threonine AMPylation protein)